MKIPFKRVGIFLLCIATAYFFLCGVIIKIAIPGFDFSALVCFFLSALFLAFLLLCYLARHHAKAARILRITLGICIALGLLLVSVTGYQVAKASVGQPDAEAEFLVILGAGLRGSTPSPSLQSRLDAAYEYMVAHPDMICVVSGGQGPDEDMSEALYMFQHLTERGISPTRIWIEDRSTSTMENLRYSLDLIEDHTGVPTKSVAILSSEYHLYRACMFAESFGVTAYGVPAKTESVPVFVNYFLREIAGIWHYILLGS